MLEFDYPCSNHSHIPAPSRLSILTMSMMDSDLKKRAENAALIHLAAPFLKVLQAICVNDADGNNAEDGGTDNDADDDADDDTYDDADVNAVDDAATQTMDNSIDNDAACRQQHRDPDNGLRCR
jgi:hypothetical protein